MIKNLRPQLAEAGKIKIGRKGETRRGQSGNEYQVPQKLDHFLITTNRRGEDGNLILDKEAMATLGDNIRAIPIVLHSDTIDAVFPTRYVLYEGRQVVCTGDGEVNDKGTACPCDALGAEKGPKCKPNGILHCSLNVPGRAVAGAVHKWRTTSIISIERMIGSLEQVLSACGALRGVPLWLVVEPVTVSPAGKQITVYCCHVECRETDIAAAQDRALRAAEMRKALGAGDGESYRALLQSPGVNEDPAEQADVADEYYPDATPDAELIEPEPPATQADALKAKLAGPVADEVDQLLDDIAKSNDLGADIAGRCVRASEAYPDRRPEFEAAWKKRKAQLAEAPWPDPAG